MNLPKDFQQRTNNQQRTWLNNYINTLTIELEEAKKLSRQLAGDLKFKPIDLTHRPDLGQLKDAY